MSFVSWMLRAGLAVAKVRSPVADLMARDPAGWEVGRFRATHQATGIKVWIANDAYGLHVELPGDSDETETLRFDPTKAERHLIWQAYQRNLEARRATTERAINRLAQRYLDSQEEA